MVKIWMRGVTWILCILYVYFPSDWIVVFSLVKTWHMTAVYIFISDRWKIITGKYVRFVIFSVFWLSLLCMWSSIINILNTRYVTNYPRKIYWVDQPHREPRVKCCNMQKIKNKNSGPYVLKTSTSLQLFFLDKFYI